MAAAPGCKTNGNLPRRPASYLRPVLLQIEADRLQVVSQHLLHRTEPGIGEQALESLALIILPILPALLLRRIGGGAVAGGGPCHVVHGLMLRLSSAGHTY